VLAVCLLLWGGGALSGADFLRLESAYLGDGWFEYRLTLAEDPYYESAGIGAVSIPFAGRSQYGANPADWISDGATAGVANWSFGAQQSQGRPYQRTFLARSSHTTFKTVDQAVKITFVATPQSALQSGQVTPVSGLLRLRGVIPCPPAEADGSAATQTASTTLREDLRLTSLVMENGVPKSLSYEWSYDSTVMLEASFDLKNWTQVATILGEAGTTTWIATVPLENAGRFYRLVLIANEGSP